jgi:RNA polymerase sigma factor for flagellar operon FliA
MDRHMDMTLWQAYRSGNEGARQRLLTEHLGLVHHVARQMSRTLAVRADFDELISAGTMGLMTALDGFDPGRGLAFSTFAAPRIRGAILDELRKQDHVPRSVRRKTREIAASRETLMRIMGRAPSDDEVAEHLGVDRDTLWKWQADVEGAHHIPLDRGPSERESHAPAPVDLLSDEEEGSGVEDRITHEQEVALLKDAIMGLKEQERTVLSLYYFEELKLHEIADILDLTESRVSQIRSKALGKLRQQLRPIRDQVA